MGTRKDTELFGNFYQNEGGGVTQFPGTFTKLPSYRVSFLTGAPIKVLSVRLHSKSHQKKYNYKYLLTGWHLEILGGVHPV